MRIYVDENLPKKVVFFMENKLRWDVKCVILDDNLQGKKDLYHHRKARKERRILLTRDKDYLDPHWFPLHRTMGIIIVEEKNTKRLIHILKLLSKFLDRAMQENSHYLSSLKIIASLSGVKLSYLGERGDVEEKFYSWSDFSFS